MKEEKNKDSLITLATPMSEVEDKILAETDVNELENIIDIFNVNLKKKDLLRVSKLNNLQDLIANQMEERISNKADEFSNQDLLTYFKTIQEAISKSDTSLKDINTQSIHIIQNQLNVNVNNNMPQLSRASKERVLDAVKAILNKKDFIIDENAEVHSEGEDAE